MITSTTAPKKTAIVFAGETLLAKTLDEKEIQVRVRAMPARHLGRVLQLCTDEASLLELVCLLPATDEDENEIPGWQRVPPGWPDNLADESHVVLLEAAKRLNFTRAAQWGERQIEAKQFQAPLLLKADELLSPLVEKMARLLISSLPSSASPAAPSTKS